MGARHLRAYPPVPSGCPVQLLRGTDDATVLPLSPVLAKGQWPPNSGVRFSKKARMASAVSWVEKL